STVLFAPLPFFIDNHHYHHHHPPPQAQLTPAKSSRQRYNEWNFHGSSTLNNHFWSPTIVVPATLANHPPPSRLTTLVVGSARLAEGHGQRRLSPILIALTRSTGSTGSLRCFDALDCGFERGKHRGMLIVFMEVGFGCLIKGVGDVRGRRRSDCQVVLVMEVWFVDA
ncbi:hypothetical protein M8C21_028133, partial [Ambrosia artemisiifolia]